MSENYPESISDNHDLMIAPELTFNFWAVLKGRAPSSHSFRAYARWIDRYLCDFSGLSPTSHRARRERMQALPLDYLLPALTPTNLRAWLGQLLEENQGKQALGQARAAIITLASLLSEAELLDDYTSAAMGNVKVPKAETGQRPGRWLAVEQVRELMQSAEAIANSPAQSTRNALVIHMLCIMALRREELTEILWKDFHTQAGRPVLLVHGKGSKAALVDVPSVVLRLIEAWLTFVELDEGTPKQESFLIRRVLKDGSVSPQGLSTDSVWRIVKNAAEHANLGKVAPHDLRRSVAGNLEMNGVPIETISRLLRHSNIAVTQNYLSKLPRQNEGAILMADLLGFDND